MNKIKWINIINITLIVFLALGDIIFGFVSKFDKRFYYGSAILLILSGIVNLIFLAIKEFAELTYDSKRFIPVAFSGHIVMGVLAYYLVKYLGGYEQYIVLYWLLWGIGLVLPIAGFIVLEYVMQKKKKNNGPKFLVNKK